MSSFTSPYKIFEPFTEADADIFFGRETEQKRLINYLKSCRLTVLYGRRGVGKTSLLHAGIAHKFRQEAQQNIKDFGVPKLAVILFDDWQATNPLEKLVEQIKDEIKKLIPNKTLPQKSLDSHPFDEILTAYSQALDEGENEGVIFIIFDKFEEYFLYHPQAEIVETESEFQVANAVNHRGLNTNFLLTIDENCLAKLDRFRQAIPDIIRNRQQLLPLDENALYEAIVNPIFKKYNLEHPEAKMGIAPDLIDKIIEDLKTIDFDTASLQLLMQCLWQQEQKNKSDLLQLETLQSLGGREVIINNYFNKRITNLTQNTVPKNVKILAKIIGYLITPGGIKIAYPLQDLAQKPGIAEAELKPLLETLTKQNLVNLVSCPTNPKQLCYEISHEILTPGILEWHNHYWETYNRQRHEVKLALDRAVPEALRQFHETSQLDALRTILDAGDTLKKAIQEDLLPSEYPTDSLQTVLQQILDEIQETQELSGHEGAACSVIFTPDGKKLASSSEDGTIRLWERQGKLLKTFEDHRNWIWNIDVSPDGRYLVSASDDGTARLWDLHLQNNTSILFPKNPASIRSAAFSPDGKLVAIAGTDGNVRLCDLEGNVRLQFSAAQVPIWCISFSPKGDYFVTASDIGIISFWDLDGRKRQENLKAHDRAAIWSVNFNQEGTMLVSGSSDKTVKLWNLETRQEPKTLRGHKSWVFSVRFHPQKSYLASASEDCTVRLWNFEGHELAKLVHNAPVQGINFSPTGELLASACGDRKIHLWDFQGLPKIKRQEGILLSVSFSHDGQYLATSSSDGRVFLWDVPHWDVEDKPLKTINTDTSWVKQVSFSPTAPYLATASADGSACLWDSSGNPIQSLVGHENSVWSINFSPDGQLLVTGSADRTIRLWNLQGQQQCQWNGASGAIWSVCFSPDGQFIASGAEDGNVRLWDLQGQQVHKFTTGKSPILSVSFSPDGQFLAGSSSAGILYIWNWQKRELFKKCIHDPAIPVWSVSFSPDSTYLASGSLDRNAYLWDLESESSNPIRILTDHQGPVRSVSFSPDGKFFVTASSDGTVRKFSTRLDKFDSLLTRGRKWLEFE